MSVVEKFDPRASRGVEKDLSPPDEYPPTWEPDDLPPPNKLPSPPNELLDDFPPELPKKPEPPGDLGTLGGLENDRNPPDESEERPPEENPPRDPPPNPPLPLARAGEATESTITSATSAAPNLSQSPDFLLPDARRAPDDTCTASDNPRRASDRALFASFMVYRP